MPKSIITVTKWSKKIVLISEGRWVYYIKWDWKNEDIIKNKKIAEKVFYKRAREYIYWGEKKISTL